VSVSALGKRLAA